MAKGVAKLGFYSRRSAVNNIDRRRPEAKLLQRVIDGLTDELGGPDKITYRQRLLIETSADLCLRLQIAMGHVASGDDVRESDRHVVHMIGALRKNLAALDIGPVQAMGPTLAEYLSARAIEQVSDAN